jgi:hypothetical protein
MDIAEYGQTGIEPIARNLTFVRFRIAANNRTYSHIPLSIYDAISVPAGAFTKMHVQPFSVGPRGMTLSFLLKLAPTPTNRRFRAPLDTSLSIMPLVQLWYLTLRLT